MAVQKVQFSYVPGETLTIELVSLGGNASLFVSATAVEAPASSGVYLASFTNASPISGAFRAVVFRSGSGVAGYKVTFPGVDLETVQAGEFVDVESLTASEVAAAVLDAQTSQHQSPGSVGLAISESASDISVILPASGVIPKRTQGETIQVFNQEQITLAVAVFDLNKNPVDLSSTNLWFGVWDRSREALFEATPTGTSTGFTVVIPKVDQVGSGLSWAVRESSAAGQVILTGPFQIVSKPYSS